MVNSQGNQHSLLGKGSGFHSQSLATLRPAPRTRTGGWRAGWHSRKGWGWVSIQEDSMPYADSQPQETPDRDWGGQLHQKIIPYSGHYRTNLSLRYKYIPKMKIFISKIKSTLKKYFYHHIWRIVFFKNLLEGNFESSLFKQFWLRWNGNNLYACPVLAVSSDATPSLERLKSAQGQRRKIGGIFRFVIAVLTMTVHALDTSPLMACHAPAAWAWRGASLGGLFCINSLQWCHPCPGRQRAARQPGAYISAIWTQAGRLARKSVDRKQRRGVRRLDILNTPFYYFQTMIRIYFRSSSHQSMTRPWRKRDQVKEKRQVISLYVTLVSWINHTKWHTYSDLQIPLA